MRSLFFCCVFAKGWADSAAAGSQWQTTAPCGDPAQKSAQLPPVNRRGLSLPACFPPALLCRQPHPFQVERGSQPRGSSLAFLSFPWQRSREGICEPPGRRAWSYRVRLSRLLSRKLLSPSRTSRRKRRSSPNGLASRCLVLLKFGDCFRNCSAGGKRKRVVSMERLSDRARYLQWRWL